MPVFAIFHVSKLHNPNLIKRGRENMLGKFAHAKAISKQAMQAGHIWAGRQLGRPSRQAIFGPVGSQAGPQGLMVVTSKNKLKLEVFTTFIVLHLEGHGWFSTFSVSFCELRVQ